MVQDFQISDFWVFIWLKYAQMIISHPFMTPELSNLSHIVLVTLIYSLHDKFKDFITWEFKLSGFKNNETACREKYQCFRYLWALMNVIHFHPQK